jgi:hypothetical protein
MLFAPFQYQSLKAVIIAYAIFTVIFVDLINRKVPINIKILLWYLVLICNGLFFILWGFLNGYSDSLKVFPVYVMWPIVYFFILCSVSSIDIINNIFRLLVFTTIFICIYSVLYLFSAIGLIPQYSILELIELRNFSEARDFITFFLPSTTSLLYLVPFLLSALLLWEKKDNMPVKTIWLYLSLIVSLIAIVFTARRIFWILIILTPFLTVLLVSLTKNEFRKTKCKAIYKAVKNISTIIIGILVVLTIVYFREVSELVEHIASSSIIIDAATFKDDGTAVRDDQFKSLLESWSETPLLGAGHGASSPLCLRSVEFPWMYEISYAALLFQTGIIGTSIYVSIILWIYYMGIKISSDARASLYIIPSLVGMSCFLIACASNTYLQAYDHMWAVFIPIMLVNYFLISKNTCEV